MAQRESRLSRRIISELESRGIFAFKVHGGPHMMAGLPDIIVCLDGKFFGLETKLPDGDDPSVIQHHVHNKIRKSKGEVFVVRSVVQALDTLGVEHDR